MGKRRNNANNGWHPQDDDHYVNNHFIYEDEYEDYADFEYNDYEIRPRHTSRGTGSRRSHPDYPQEDYSRRGSSSRPARRPAPRQRHRVRQVEPPRKRRSCGTLLIGCLIGIFLVVAGIATLVLLGITSLQNGGHITNIPGIVTTRSYTQIVSQEVTLSQLAQITICDKVGNIDLKVDPTLTKATITANKTVQSTSQTDADKQLKAETVEVQPPDTISQPLPCTQQQTGATPTATAITTTTPSNTTRSSLVVNITIPQPASNSVDLTIALPPAAIQSNQPALLVNIGGQQGNVQVDGLSGVLNVHAVTGNIAVQHAILANGSQLATNQGNVSFNGFLLMPPAGTQQSARYLINCEAGNINMTLPTNTNVTLDANTNIGTIKSDFPINVNNSGGANGGPASYNGPLNSSNSATGNPASATLVLDVSTGNVNIAKAQNQTGG